MGLSRTEVIETCQSSFFPLINDALGKLFTGADQAIIQMAVDAPDNNDQNRYFEAAQSLRIVKHETSYTFVTFLMMKLDPDLQDPELLEDIDEAHVDSLRSLMSIDSDSWRADKNLAVAVLDLQERINSLDCDVENPLTPKYFINSFLSSLATADIDIHSKMLVLRMFESQVYGKLERMIREANEALAAKGVLPDLETEPSETTLTMNAIVDATLGSETASQHSQQESQLEQALSQLQKISAEVQKQAIASETIKSSPEGIKVRDIEKELNDKGLMPANLTSDDKVQLARIDLVAKLFQYILDDSNLPVEARALIAQLQLPYTRIAISDDEFLQNNKHPGKTLLNEITRVCANWHINKNKLDDDPLFRKLVLAIDNFIDTENVSTFNYSDLIFDFLAYGESQRQKDSLATERLLQSQYSAEAAEQARQDVDSFIDARLQEYNLPQAATRILEEGWSHVLYFALLKHGKECEQWQQACSVVDELISTLQPASEYSSRPNFLVRLPSLLRALREGLSAIKLSPEMIYQMLSDLEQVHKETVIAIGGDLEGFIRPEVKSRKEIQQIFEESEQEKHRAVELAASQKAVSDNIRKIHESLRQGMSLIWNQEEDKKVRCRIAAHIKHTDKFILTDRSGAKLAEFPGQELAEKIESSEFEIIDSEQMFDRALESVIGGIREKR